MRITAEGHHGGDAAVFCEKLSLEAGGDWNDAQRIALLNRVLANPQMRERLLDAAEGIEAGALAAYDPAFT